MARKKLSEFSAKTLVFKALGVPYEGIPVIIDQVKGKTPFTLYPSRFTLDNVSGEFVVKVDQGVKGRMKKGLVKLKVKSTEIQAAIEDLAKKGYSRFLVEEFVPHQVAEERYFSLERTREGIFVYYAAIGGIDIEQNLDKVKKAVIPYNTVIPDDDRGSTQIDSRLRGNDEKMRGITNTLGISSSLFQKILQFFQDQYISFLEINPFILHNSEFLILDLAVEVDSTTEFFVQNGWSATDFVEETQKEKTTEEENIILLKSKSQAAFTFDLLNPNGSIWMLLSGGGASIVLADEVYNLGFGKELANYGEYSGNPNQEETYIYTKNVLALLLKSNAKKKVLIIGGGVANFTDIRTTFTGVIRALDEKKTELKKQGVRVFVRRGGPNQTIGLANMKTFLESADILGKVVGPDVMITEIVSNTLNL